MGENKLAFQVVKQFFISGKRSDTVSEKIGIIISSVYYRD